MGTSQKNLQIRSTSGISSRAAVTGTGGPNAVVGSGNPDVLVNSAAPRRKTKNDIRIFNDKNVVFPSKETFMEQNDNGTVIDGINENGDCSKDPDTIEKVSISYCHFQFCN